MRRLISLGLLAALATGVLGCGARGSSAPAEPGAVVATAGDVRFSLPTAHRVVVERRTAHGWGEPAVVFEDGGRECGTVHAIAAGSTVAATVGCDEHFAADQAPTRSVALISADGRSWADRDLAGEAFATPGLAPGGDHAVWAQAEGLLTWDAGAFGTAPPPPGSPQVVTVDDSGAVLGGRVATSNGRCAVEIRTSDPEATPASVPVAAGGILQCEELGLSLSGPSEIHGDLSGEPGTGFVVRRTGGTGWRLAARPPITAPGLSVYPDDAARAVWNQVTATTRGDLVAVGSPDRRRVTAQRYDRARQRWTPPRVVHVADGPTCRRRPEDSGVLQGATFRLRLVCDGRLLVLHSRAGERWSAHSGTG